MIRTYLAASVILLAGSVPALLEKVKLEFKYPEGTSSTIESQFKLNQVLTIAGMDRKTGSERKVTAIRSVGKRGADGRLPVQQKIESLSVQLLTGSGATINFDSANPKATNDDPMIQAILDSLRARIGSSYTIVMGKDNKVVAIEGAEKVLENATPAAAQILRAEINPEQMKAATEEAMSVLPTDPVAVGDSWTRTSNLRIGGGQTLTFETQYEYQGTVDKGSLKLDKIATATTSVAYSVDNTAQFKVPHSNLKIAMSKGTILFDRAKGQVVESNSLTQITGDITFSANGMEFPATLNLTMDSISHLVK